MSALYFLFRIVLWGQKTGYKDVLLWKDEVYGIL